MMQPTPSHSGPSFTHACAGPASGWRQWGFVHPRLGAVRGKAFLKQALGLDSMEISLASLPPGAAIPFLHRHRLNEEAYVVLSGRGEFQVDGTTFPISEGSVVRVAPGGARAYRNTGDEPMLLLVVQALASASVGGDVEDGLPVEGSVTW